MKFELEVVKFNVADVITASGAAPAPVENATPDVCDLD